MTRRRGPLSPPPSKPPMPDLPPGGGDQRMRDWFRHHARITMADVQPGFTPPSASMNPDATVSPWPSTQETTAQITRVARWRYEIRILNGAGWIATEYGTWYRFGRARAEAKARRELARYKAEQERETWTIT